MKSPEELPAHPPDLERFIFPGEHIISIIEAPDRQTDKQPSGIRELYRLASATAHSEVGAFGPTIASLALESELGETPEELRLYEAFFGRDSLRVALDLLPSHPRLMRATLIALAELQGLEYDKSREEEPGRIIHEHRKPNDPIKKRLTESRGWGWPYYGSVDSTPEFVRAIKAFCNKSPDGPAFLFHHYKDKAGSPRIMADALTFAVNWLVQRIDSNPEGLIESSTSLPKGGIENQVWKDSWDAYFHADGTIANHDKGVASIEVQRVTYDALLDAAELYETLGRREDAAKLKDYAARLKSTIFSEFWTEEKGGYFVLGTDRDDKGNLRPLKIRTSNMGHLLHSRLLESKDKETSRYRRSVISNIFSPEMLAPGGVRTLASDEARFRPFAYHNGSVWLWDTHFIAKGLRRHGYHRLSEELSGRLFHIIDSTKRFPEFVRGDESIEPTLSRRTVTVWDEINKRENCIEQPPQEIQAWTVAAILALKYHNATNSRSGSRPFRDDFEEKVFRSIPR